MADEARDDPSVAQLRGEIDACDRALLAALNRRLDTVKRLHDHKAQHGYDLSDPAREQQIIATLRAVNTGPLDDAGVASLVGFLLGVTRGQVARVRGQGWG